MNTTQLTKEDLIAFVDKMAAHHDAGRLPFAVHLPGGNEDELIALFKHINDDDYVLSTHRNWYHALLHGLPPDEVEAKILDARSMFMFDRKRNFYVSAIIGGTVAIAVGIAWALKRKGSKQRVWCFIGDGTEDSGHLAEAARYVDGHDLPCTFVIEDDGMAVEASKKVRWGTEYEQIEWPSCVTRYYYKKTRPHIRTGKFAPVDVMKATLKKPEDYFPKEPKKLYDDFDYSPKLDLSYKDAITKAMTELGEDDKTIFIGYSLIPGNAMGTLKNVPDNQKIETPVAENLMMGLAIGMSFEGFKPVVYFERHDFMMVAADAIVNHMDKIERISHGEFKCPVILKTVVDDGGMFYSGPTHSQDFSLAFSLLVDFPVFQARSPEAAYDLYRYARKMNKPAMVVEFKSKF
jgi:Transketolase, pyrimidine binding domain/Dehydrogenase E1 component